MLSQLEPTCNQLYYYCKFALSGKQQEPQKQSEYRLLAQCFTKMWTWTSRCQPAVQAKWEHTRNTKDVTPTLHIYVLKANEKNKVAVAYVMLYPNSTTRI